MIQRIPNPDPRQKRRFDDLLSWEMTDAYNRVLLMARGPRAKTLTSPVWKTYDTAAGQGKDVRVVYPDGSVEEVRQLFDSLEIGG